MCSIIKISAKHQPQATYSWFILVSIKKKVRPSGGQGGQTHDAEIEAELDAWVRAKRKGNFEKADEIRAQLREKGIATEKERPFKRKGKEKAS